MPVAELQPGSELGPSHEGGFRYEVQCVLGSGGFGITYRALDRRLNGTVVIKELAFEGAMFRDTSRGTLRTFNGREEVRDKLVERFVKEAQMLNSVRNPHIVRVTDVWRERGTAYYAMDEVVNSQPLPNLPLVDNTGALYWSQVEAWAMMLLGALETVHEHNLVHGDVKPPNVLLAPSGDIVLIDFGTARSDQDIDRTATSMAFTMGYAPPELMHPGRIREGGAWSDLYSWAMVVVGLCVTHPTERGMPQDAYDRLVVGDRYRNVAERMLAAGAPAQWAEILQRCLGLDPTTRPRSTTQVRAALEGVLGQQPAGTIAGAAPITTPPTLSSAMAPTEDVVVADDAANTWGETDTSAPGSLGASGPAAGSSSSDGPTSEIAPASVPIVPRPKVEGVAKKGTSAKTWALIGLLVGVLAFLIGIAALVLSDDGTGDLDSSIATSSGSGPNAGTTALPDTEPALAVAAQWRERVVGTWQYDVASTMVTGLQQPENILQQALAMTAAVSMQFTPDGQVTQSSTQLLTGQVTSIGTWDVRIADDLSVVLDMTFPPAPTASYQLVSPSDTQMLLHGPAGAQAFVRVP